MVMECWGRNIPDTKHYKGFTLRKCWCGYPEMRWLVYYGYKCYGACKTLLLAKKKANEIMLNFAY